MAKENKAHTATANRIARLYGATVNSDGQPDIQTADFVVEVETSATLGRAIRRLKNSDRPAFVAVTNKEALQVALQLAHRTTVGVMDSQGEIKRQSEPPLVVKSEESRPKGEGREEKGEGSE